MKKGKIKILFIFGTRPEAIKMAPVIREFRKNKQRFAARICVTAQHRQMLDQVLRLFDIKPHDDLNIMTRRQSLPGLTAKVLKRVTAVLEKENPDLVFVQGDTITTLAAAQAAYYLRIPVAHIEAGLRTGHKYSPFPEEMNRRLTSVLCDFHFAPTPGAKRNLTAEGFPESSICVTGNTVIDALLTVVRSQQSKAKKKMLEEYFTKTWGLALTAGADKSRLILVTGHRRESFGAGFKNICRALRHLAENNKDVQIVYPVHLNPNVQAPVRSILGNIRNVHLLPPLDYEPFVFLMSQSYLILTDSGGIQEEAPSLGVPVLVLRDTSERPEGIRAGSARLTGTDAKIIVKETQKLLDDKRECRRMARVVNPYGDGKASQRIVKCILNHFGRNR